MRTERTERARAFRSGRRVAGVEGKRRGEANRRTRRNALALSVLSVLSVPAAAAQSPESILARAEAAYQRAGTFRADFVQIIVNPMLGGPEETRGTIALDPPNRFAMRFTEPAGDRIIADGTWLWIYAPSSTEGQVIRQPIPVSGPVSPNLVAQFVERPLERYQVSYVGPDSVAGRLVDVVRLVPHDPDFPFRRADVAIDRETGLLRRLGLVERSGQGRTLVFHNVETGVTIPNRVFAFEVPKGVKVVTP
jgi:outer membrane lipoprotein carrier protein